MEFKPLLLANRHDEWTYARLIAIDVDGENISCLFAPRRNDSALEKILAEYRGLVGFACDDLTCHASIRGVERREAFAQELVMLNCRRVELKSTLDLVAEEKVEQCEGEWDKPLRELARYDGMMGFAEALPVRPGFVTLVNHTAWRILLGRNMPHEYGAKGRVTDFSRADGSANPAMVKLMETLCPFQLLYPLLGQRQEEFLVLARLFARYLLLDRGVVSDIRELNLTPGEAGELHVSFSGARAGVTESDLPILVMVRETCRLLP